MEINLKNISAKLGAATSNQVRQPSSMLKIKARKKQERFEKTKENILYY